jgi:hypothetical protein
MTDLKALAQAATPGPWRVANESDSEEHDDCIYNDNYRVVVVANHDPEHDAPYLAAASPDVILALLAIRDAADYITGPDVLSFTAAWAELRAALAAYALTEGATE